MHYKQYKHILSANNGINIYRGCNHGCIYCDSRSLCYNMQHKFEDIEVKEDAPLILEKELSKKKKRCMIGTGSMTDSYIQLEEQLQYTRKCLEVINKYGFGLTIQTKSNRILRDLDLLIKINNNSKCVVAMTLTTYDEELCKIIEPNVSTTKERFEILKTLRDNNIKTVVWLCPILPYINDTEENLRGILNYCIEAKVYGILCFNMGLTLREGNREYFYEQLDKNFPGIKEKYINRYGNNYQIISDNNAKLMKIFYEECKKNNIVCNNDEIFSYFHEFKEKDEQLSLF